METSNEDPKETFPQGEGAENDESYIKEKEGADSENVNDPYTEDPNESNEESSNIDQDDLDTEPPATFEDGSDDEEYEFLVGEKEFRTEVGHLKEFLEELQDSIHVLREHIKTVEGQTKEVVQDVTTFKSTISDIGPLTKGGEAQDPKVITRVHKDIEKINEKVSSMMEEVGYDSTRTDWSGGRLGGLGGPGGFPVLALGRERASGRAGA